MRSAIWPRPAALRCFMASRMCSARSWGWHLLSPPRCWRKCSAIFSKRSRRSVCWSELGLGPGGGGESFGLCARRAMLAVILRRGMRYCVFMTVLKTKHWVQLQRISVYSNALSWMRRYSICPRSPSSPMGPVAGSFRASSSTSPLHSQCATFSFTVTMMVFQSCGLYFFNSL